MPRIEPFRGIHYDPLRTFGLSPVIGPPEDIPHPDDVARIVAGRPYHSLRLEVGDPESGKTEPPATLRSDVFERWLAEGILVRDERPSFYVHEHRYRQQGIYHRRLGLFAVADLADDDRYGIRPHEGTIPENLAFRFDLLKRLRVSISPLLTMVRDGGWLGALLAETVHGRPPDLSGHDDEEGIHRVWTLNEPGRVEWIRRLVAGQPLYIADGHHRYAAARKYRAHFEKSGIDPGPARFVMTLIVSEFDPGLTILPIHREIRRLDLPWQEIRSRIETLFEVECALPAERVNPEIVARRAERLSDSGNEHTEFLLLGRGDPQLCRIRLKDSQTVDQLLGSQQYDAIKDLDVTVLHRVLLEHSLGLPQDDPDGVVSYTPDAEGVASRVLKGESELGLFVRTTRIEQVLAVADAGAHMPQKSTYFYPKVPAGLVMYDLEPAE